MPPSSSSAAVSLDQAAEALELGRRSLRTIRECYALALGLNSVLLVLTTFGLLSPVGGALLHNLTTMLTVAKASTLARRPAALVSNQKAAQRMVVE